MAETDHIEQPKRAVLMLSFDQSTFQMEITGAIPNLNVALAMLSQATRELERRASIAAAQEGARLTLGALPLNIRGPRQ